MELYDSMLDVRLGYASVCKRVAGHTHWRSFFGAAAFLVVLDRFFFPSCASVALAIFFPSCASVALARSSHIVVLMNELSRCNCNVPLWGVESGVGTITQSEVKSGPNHRENQKTTKAKTTQKPKTNQTTKTAKGALTSQLQRGWQIMPLNCEILHRNKHKTPEQSKILRRCPAKQSTQQRQNPGSPLPGSRRSRREALQA